MFPGSTQQYRGRVLSICGGDLVAAYHHLVANGHHPTLPTERNTRRRLDEAAGYPVAGISTNETSGSTLSPRQQTALMENVQQRNSYSHMPAQSVNEVVTPAAPSALSASSTAAVVPLEEKSLQHEEKTHYAEYLKGHKNRKLVNIDNLPIGPSPSDILRELARAALADPSSVTSIVIYWPKKYNGWCHMLAVTHPDQEALVTRLRGLSLSAADPPLKVKPMKRDNKCLDKGQINFSASRSLRIIVPAPTSPTAPRAVDTNLASTNEADVAKTESSSHSSTAHFQPSEVIPCKEEDEEKSRVQLNAITDESDNERVRIKKEGSAEYPDAGKTQHVTITSFPSIPILLTSC
ncbi:hypothetical protein GGR57DRAFT_515907 [Xylariaceae sp. FL1272]|nr:hypothetical protein GGR57DRAFT_515907 [Xylariaceae sp. FL1272]